MEESSSASYNNHSDVSKLKISKVGLLRLEYPYEIEGTFSSSISLQDIFAEFNSLCIRYNEGVYYVVARTNGNDKVNRYLFMLLNDELQFKDGMLLHKLTEKKNYDNIKVGMSTAEDINKIDFGTVIIDNVNESGLKAVSYHRFIDGTMLVIRYTKMSEKWIVEDMVFKDDPTKFINYLLPQDLELIK